MIVLDEHSSARSCWMTTGVKEKTCFSSSPIRKPKSISLQKGPAAARLHEREKSLVSWPAAIYGNVRFLFIFSTDVVNDYISRLLFFLSQVM